MGSASADGLSGYLGKADLVRTKSWNTASKPARCGEQKVGPTDNASKVGSNQARRAICHPACDPSCAG